MKLQITEALVLINWLIDSAYNIHKTISEAGGIGIPAWEELTSSNKILQDKIDKEKIANG